MKKLLSIAILAMMVATPVFFVSCGNDDDMLPEESEITKPTIASWTEPFHGAQAQLKPRVVILTDIGQPDSRQSEVLYGFLNVTLFSCN